MYPSIYAKSICLAACLATATPGYAMDTNYGNFEGSTLFYNDVLTPDGGLLGAPDITGDRLNFSSGLSTSFQINVASGAAATLGASFNSELNAKAGHALSAITVSTSGFYWLVDNATGGSATASTAASSSLRIVGRVTEVDGIALPSTVILAPQEEDVVSTTYPDDPSGNLVDWNGSITYNVHTRAQAVGIFGDITGLLITVSTGLAAESESQTRARIALRQFDSITLTVPEPASAALLVAPLMLGLIRRRRD